MTQRARLYIPTVLLLFAALLLWIASRVTWVDVITFNDQSGEIVRSLSGTDWQPGLVPVALGAVAAVAAVALVRGSAARAVGAVFVLLGVAAGGLMLSGLGEPDRDRAHTVVTGEQEIGRTDAGPGTEDGQRVPEWSEITGTSTNPVGPAITGAGALSLVGAGLIVMVRPARRSTQDARYSTPAAQREARNEVATARASSVSGTGTSVSAESGRDLWQELDAGRDPTE